MNIFVYHIALVENILGFGKRIVIWLSGCPFDCKGCIEPDLHDINAGKSLTVNELSNIISDCNTEYDGITFSGGEPLFQAEALLELLKLLPEQTNKMLYTGYEMENIKDVHSEILRFFDLVVDGKFEMEHQGNFLWRGSENQKLWSPNGSYDDDFLAELHQKPSAGMEIVVRDRDFHFYGIPLEGQLEGIREKLKREGVIYEQ